jgi:preprotein translocase subunit SecA
VVIVDEFTGRLMPGRRWSDGLHQAIEAKEGVKIQRENQTLATITFQNYFRMYKKLAGMTGTAETEAAEFQKIYKLDVVVPDQPPMIRKENQDMVYRTEEEKFRNAAKEIKSGTRRASRCWWAPSRSRKSEKLSGILKRMGVRHEVLNAKNHEREASSWRRPGARAQVTVSTNMAGRGTDILLGGNPEFMTKDACLKDKLAGAPARGPRRSTSPTSISTTSRTTTSSTACAATSGTRSTPSARRRPTWSTTKWCRLGGLHIVGTERHESRRIDNQLRGRAGRQGDPGSSRFFLSLQDDLLRIFGGERMQNLMLRLGMEEDVPIESGMITKRIARRRKPSKCRTSRPANTCWNTTTS